MEGERKRKKQDVKEREYCINNKKKIKKQGMKDKGIKESTTKYKGRDAYIYTYYLNSTGVTINDVCRKKYNLIRYHYL